MEQHILHVSVSFGTKTCSYSYVCFPRVSLSASEWCVLKELVQILQPLEDATRKLSAERRVSCSKVTPLLNAACMNSGRM